MTNPFHLPGLFSKRTTPDLYSGKFEKFGWGRVPQKDTRPGGRNANRARKDPRCDHAAPVECLQNHRRGEFCQPETPTEAATVPPVMAVATFALTYLA
jgi:hypothetical protein